VTTAEVFARYDRDPAMRRLVDDTIELMAVYLANLVIAFDPERVVLAGGLMRQADVVLPRLRAVFERVVANQRANVGLVPQPQFQLRDGARSRLLGAGRSHRVLAPRAADGIAGAMRGRELPYVLGGRDFTAAASGGTLTLAVGDERYVELALGGGDDPELAATGIVTALAIGSLGVRMRPEWVEQGARAAAARE